MLKKMLSSANGTLNWLLIVSNLLFFAGTLYGIEQAPIGLAITGVVGLFGLIRDRVKEKRSPQWAGNSWAYLLVVLNGFAPWAAETWELLPQLFDAIKNGGWSAVFGFLIPLVNQVLYYVKEKPWQQAEPPANS